MIVVLQDELVILPPIKPFDSIVGLGEEAGRLRRKLVLDRAHEAALRNQVGFRQLEETNPDDIANANAHIRIPLSQ